VTLWNPEKLQQSLRTSPQINTDFKVTASDSIEDKSSLLSIDGSLKLSLLGGLVSVTGAAKYLNDTKKSFRQQRLTLHYHSTCEFKQLTMNHLGPENIVYQDVFDNDTATHVVTAVLYGADACFVFDREVSADENKSTVEGEAKVALEKLKFISGDANINLKMNDTQKNAVQKFTCTFYGDFQLKSNPTTFEDALKVFADLPKLLGEKKELVVPVKVWLHPLDKLHSRALKLQKDIGMNLIIAIESVIESLNTAEMKSSDLLKDSPALTFTSFHDQILQMKQNCYKYKLNLVNKLSSLLPNIRGNVMKETALNDLLKEHDESPFRGQDLTEWLTERERESEIIKSVLKQLEDAGAQVEVNMDLNLMNLEVGNRVCFMFTSLKWSDVLLLQQKTCLNPSATGRNDESSTDRKQKSWLNPEIQKIMRSNLKMFKNLIDLNDSTSDMFIVSSREMKNNPGSCILLYESECDEAVCFVPPSKPAFPVIEEVKENTVVVKVPPLCPATLELRLLYKPKQDSDWTSNAVMKNQNTVVLTDLGAGTEYEIKCAALGKLNYTTDSDVISVTTEEGMDSAISKSTQSLTTAEDMRNEIKLMMQPYANWEDYLIPGSVVIAFLGELIVISSTTEFSINNNPPKHGYKFIKYPDSFHACFVQVCNSVEWAFKEAHKSMYQICLHTVQVPDYMKTAVHILFQGSDEVVKAHLPDELENVKVIANECLVLSDATEKRFTDVLNIIQELLEACLNAEHFYVEESKLRKMSAKETRTEMLVKGMDAMGRLKKQLERIIYFFQMVVSTIKSSMNVNNRMTKTLEYFITTSEKTQALSNNAKLLKDRLYTQAFQAYNIAGLVHMICRTYTDVSNKYLMDCVSSLGKLMVMDKNKPEFEHERQQLQNGCDEAQRGILNLVLKNKEEFDRKSTARFDKIKRIQEVVQS
ncbi:hypothetical protein QQF64_018576, partial [Cirrhinus molitorella]